MVLGTRPVECGMSKTFLELTPRGLKALSQWEGRINYVYDDAVYPTKPYKAGTKIKGNLTAGVGHLLSRGNDIFSEANKWIGHHIPDAVIDKWLDDDTDAAERAVDQLVRVPLHPYQRDVMISFVFNIGVSAFERSTLLKKLNRGDYAAVPKELMKWVKTTINGKKVTSDGLVARRSQEVTYWLSGEAPVPAERTVPSGTQIAEAEKQKVTPLEIATGAGSIIGPAAGFANATGPVAYAFLTIAVVAALVIGAIVLKRYVFTNPQPQTKLAAY